MRALVIEPEPKLAVSIREALAAEGFKVSVAKRMRKSEPEVQAQGFRVIVLDLSSNADGFEFLQNLRSRGVLTPVLLLAREFSLDERVAALRAGADCCLSIPFDLLEMSARVEALARRNRTNGSVLLQIADLTLDPVFRTVTRGERTVRVARLEYCLLEFLVRRQGRICSRDLLLQKVWGYAAKTETNLVDVTIRRLRGKLDLPGETPLLHTIRSEGYVVRLPLDRDLTAQRRRRRRAAAALMTAAVGA